MNSDERIQSLEQQIAELTRRELELRRTEADSRENEDKFRAVVENIPNCIVTTLDEDLRFTFVGGKGLETIGLSSAQIIGRRIDEILSPEQVKILLPKYAAAWQGEIVSFEFLFRPEALYLATIAPLRGHDGEIHCLICTSIDITARRVTEIRIERLNRTHAVLSAINELIVRERHPRRILERACGIALDAGQFKAAWIGLSNPDTGRIHLEASAGMDQPALEIVERYLASAETNCHITHEAISTRRASLCNDIANDPDSAGWREAALARQFRSMVSLPLLKGDELIGIFNLYSHETDFFDDQEMRLLVDLAADIAFAMEFCEHERERQRAAEQLRVNEERFRALIENVSDIITVINNHGLIRFQSPSVTKILGYRPEEMLGKLAFNFIHPDDAGPLAAAIERSIRHPDVAISVEYRMQHKNRAWRVLHSIGRSATGLAEDGFIVVASRDITETRRLEEQLRQSQKMEAIGQLAGGVAHDFNNILAAMLMQAELILETPALPEETIHGVREIRASAERGANLTRQLLLFSRRQVLQPRIINLNEIVTSLSRMLQRLIGEDIHLQLHLNPAPLIVRADPGMIDQILLNLAVNARDAMSRGGRLTIETNTLTVEQPVHLLHGEARPGRYAGLTVTDTGAGIPPEIMPHIFEPFFTTKEAGKGTGLGLATVFGIVNQHHGWIDVQSVPAHGASFRIFFPASELTAVPPAETTSDLPRGHEGILLVEDESAVRALTRVMLKRHGYTVFEAANGAEALDLWRTHAAQIELLLTDLVMPGGLTGRQLALELQKERPGLAILYASGYSAEFIGREIQTELGECFLQKPFSQRDLLIAVRRQLDAPATPKK